MVATFRFAVCIGALMLMGISINSFSQGTQDALAYMTQIGQEIKSIKADTWNYVRAVAHNKSARKIESKRSELVRTTQEAQNRIRRMPGFKGDPSLRDSVVAYLKINYLVLKEDYDKIIDMEEVAEQSYDLMEAYLLAQERAEEKLNEAGAQASRQQRAFAEKHGIQLVDDESKTGKNLEAAGKMQKYYNTIFLVYFKSYKQEMYVIDAFNRGDINALEQNRAALIVTAKEGKETLGPMSAFQHDLTLKAACQKALDFFEKEAVKSIPPMVDFLIEKESFGKITSAIESVPAGQRTQEDIDRYNKAVEKYNKALQAHNTLNQSVNKERALVLNGWNKAAQEFTSKHTPKR